MAEALVLCRRLGDARAACEELPPGPARDVLVAEALWRDGDVAGARAALARGGGGPAGLAGRLAELESSLGAVEDALGAGRWDEAAEACRRVARWEAAPGEAGGPRVVGQAAGGLFAALSVSHARALREAGRPGDALGVLEEASRWRPGHAGVLREMARCQLRAGRPEEALGALRGADGGGGGGEDRGLEAEAAAGVLGRGAPGGPRRETRPGGHYATLGVPVGASAREVRAAYRALSLRHHPDKRRARGAAAGPPVEYLRVAEAYAALSDGATRAAYDAAHTESVPGGPAARGGLERSRGASGDAFPRG